MSFIKRAQEAAAQAAESAKHLAQDAATSAGAVGVGGQTAGTPGEPGAATGTATGSATIQPLGKGLSGASAGAREALGMAKRGMNTVIEKIDPATLADLVIKATALQEMTNKALRKKGSPYRIAEISISASIPPAVSFAISRLGDEPEEVGAEIVSSSELVETTIENGDLVLALDGTTVDGTAVEPSGVDVPPGAMPPSSVSNS